MMFAVKKYVDGETKFDVVEADNPFEAMNVSMHNDMFSDELNEYVTQGKEIVTVGVFEVGRINHLEEIDHTQQVRNFYHKKLSELGYDPHTFERLNEESQMNNDLFEYKDEAFNAKNLDSAMTRFLDEAWGVHYVNHLESKGDDTKKIGAVKNLKDIEFEHFYDLIQELENGDILHFQVWINDDGTYKGLAKEVLEVKENE